MDQGEQSLAQEVGEMQRSDGTKPRAASFDADAIADGSGVRAALDERKTPGMPAMPSSPDEVAASVVARAFARHSYHPTRWEEEPVTGSWRAPQSSWADVRVDELIPSAPPPGTNVGAPAIPPAARVPTMQRPPTPPGKPAPGVRFIPSTGPVALDTKSSSAPPTLRSSAAPPRRRSDHARALAAGLIAACALFVGVMGLRLLASPPVPPPARAAAAPPEVPPTRVPLSATPAPAAVAPSAPAEATPAPASTTGIVVGTQGRRLFVDGKRVQHWRAEVTCGPHAVRNGSRGAYRQVDVPCGGEIAVAPH